ncbi:MAG: fumarylacetoacetate hydrolase family protein [Bacteroidota bacterium]|nr:fumarylacetoacetate hydrolase family protein [Bacteroidota bacterium]MDX5430681.1 fumarylacetoacetate hydrolase family protein [Bacteroidota bacterium]MDX5469428.1 fumarylacetoacetate hydrolase family protein [Bacteroidota bacterium]
MKIICIGRNYRDHAKELGNDVPSEPVIFLKPDSSLLKPGQVFFVPDQFKEVHHEVELVIRIARNGKHIAKRFAHKYYDEIGLGIDFTARDKQNELKQKGLPWELAKGFDGSAVISKMTSKSELPPVQEIRFSLKKNGETVQEGITSDMLFQVDEIIAFVSQYFTLKMGDLIYTGTPAGVGPVHRDDILEGYLQDKKVFTCKVK